MENIKAIKGLTKDDDKKITEAIKNNINLMVDENYRVWASDYIIHIANGYYVQK